MNNSSLSKIYLAAAILVLWCFHWLGYTGHFGFDDMQYSELAKNLVDGKFIASDHFSFRLPLIFLTALSYLILGVNDTASSIPPLLFSTLNLWLIYQILKHQKPIAIGLALFLTLSSEWYLFYSDKLMPDIFVCSAFILAYFAADRQYFKKKEESKLNAFLFAFALFLGFNSKGTIVLIIPWVLYLFIRDLLSKQNANFWKATILFSIGFGALYLLSCYLIFGDAMIRFKALTAGSYLNRCSYESQSTAILINRITKDFWRMTYADGLLLSFLLFIPAFFSRTIFERFKLNSQFNFLAVSAIILLFSSNFMSISWTGYNPMCLDTRHYLFVIPMAAMAAAIYLSQTTFLQSKKWVVLGIATITIATLLYYDQELLFQEYLFPLILVSVLALFKLTKTQSNVTYILLLLSLLIKPIDMVLHAQDAAYKDQREIIYKELISKPEPKYVITNKVQSRIGNYYAGFDYKTSHFLAYEEFDPDTLKNRDLYILKNWQSRALSFLNTQDLPMYAQLAAEEDKITEGKGFDLQIYKVDALSNVSNKEDTLLVSKQDMEGKHKHWSLPENDLELKTIFNGKASNKVYEYSTTFRYELDSLPLSAYKLLLINTEAYTYFKEPTEAKFVVSITHNDETVFWQSAGIEQQLKSYSHWWPVKARFSIPTKSIPSNAKATIYIWNSDFKQAFVDDFEVSFTAIP